MPKRGVVASILTTIALVLLINFKTPSQQGLQLSRGGGAILGQPAQGAGTVAQDPAQGSGGSGGQGYGGASQAGNGQGSTDQSGAGAGGTGQGSTDQSGSGGGATSAPTAAPKAASKSSGDFTGSVVSTPFGDIQVQVKLSGGHIADVVALQLPNDRFRSQMIAQYAAPILRNEALQAQSSNIDIVSGATYTSEGYAQSLQSALDQAKS